MKVRKNETTSKKRPIFTYKVFPTDHFCLTYIKKIWLQRNASNSRDSGKVYILVPSIEFEYFLSRFFPDILILRCERFWFWKIVKIKWSAKLF